MEDEDLQKNPLFLFFQNQKDLFARAAKDKFVVCIPAADALQATRINKDFLLTHILKQSPYFTEVRSSTRKQTNERTGMNLIFKRVPPLFFRSS